jgi:hypothetical protein
MPSKKRLFINESSCSEKFLWKQVDNKKRMKPTESRNLEVNKDTSMSIIDKKMSSSREGLCMLIPILL